MHVTCKLPTAWLQLRGARRRGPQSAPGSMEASSPCFLQPGLPGPTLSHRAARATADLPAPSGLGDGGRGGHGRSALGASVLLALAGLRKKAGGFLSCGVALEPCKQRLSA